MPSNLWEYDWKVDRKGIMKISLLQKSKFTESLQFGAQVCSDASSIKNSGFEGGSAKRMRKFFLKKIPAWQLTEARNKRWSKKQGIGEEKIISRHSWISVISRIRSWSHNIKSTKAESCSEVTLWRMIQDLMQYSQSKVHLHHKWQQRKSWISFPDCLVAMDKQLMPYLLFPN